MSPIADGTYRDPVSGKPVIVRGGKVQLRGRDGRLFEEDPKEAGYAILKGDFSAASEDDLGAFEAEKRSGGVAGAARTVAEQAAVGAYGGATALPRAAGAVAETITGPKGPSVTEIGPQALGEAIAESVSDEGSAGFRERREVNPGAAMTGQVAGEIAGGVAGPGAVLSRGATPLQRVAGGAVEGAAFGGSQAAEDAFVGNQPLTRDKVLSAMGLGAVLGGGAALGVEGAARVFRRVGSRGATPFDSPRELGPYRTKSAPEYEELARRALGDVEAGPGLGGKLRDAVEAAQSATTGAERDTLAKYGATRWDDAARSGRALWRNREEILEGATRELTDNVDRMARSSRDVFDEVVEARLKREHVRGKLGGEEAQMLAVARAETARLRQELQGIALDADQFGNKRLVRNTRKLLQELAEDVRASDDAAEAFITLDRAKRALQRQRVSLGRSAARQPDALMAQQARALGQRFEELQEGTRQLLMDESVWGAAAQDQARINAAWENWFESRKLFDKNFLTRTGETFDGRPIVAGDPSKVASYVRRMGRQEAKLVDEHFRHHVMATQRLSDAINEAFDLGEKAAQVQAVRDSAETISKTLGKADETVRVANQIDAVIEAEGSSGIPTALLGGALGGPLGAMAGAAYAALTKPGTMIKTLAAIEALGANVDARIGKSLKRVVLSVPDMHLPTNAPRRLPGKTARRAAVSATLKDTTDDRTERRERYRERTKLVAEVSASPALMNERLQKATAAISKEAPKLAGAMSMSAVQGMQFLQSKVPAGGQMVNAFGQVIEDTEASDEEITRFNLYWHAVTNPLSVLDDLENGMLMEEQVEALEAVYPDLLTEIRLQTRVRLASRKEPLPYDTRAQLDMLLGLGGAGEPSYDPGFQQRLAAIVAEQPQTAPRAPRPPGAASKLADKYRTQSAELEAEL